MEKKYCQLDSDGLFIKISDIKEFNELKSSKTYIYDYPPNITSNQIAIWKDDHWMVRRKESYLNKKNNESNKYILKLKEKTNLGIIKEKIHKKYREIPKFSKIEKVQNKVIANKLKIEQTYLHMKLIDLFENNKRITKKLKIYKKDLDKKIKELESPEIKNNLSDITYDANNQISIIDIIPSKVPF